MVNLVSFRQKLDLESELYIETMVVDDERDFCIKAAEYLQQQNPSYRCDTAFSVDEAINKLSGRPYDLLSADWMFGNSGAGWLMFNPARKRNPWLGIIVFTMYPDVEQKALETGASTVIDKQLAWPNGCFLRTANEVTVRSLKRKLTEFARTPPYEDAFMYATSPHAGTSPDVPEKELKEIVESILKIQLFDEKLTFVKRLRFDRIARWMMEPQRAFVLCFIRDFGPIELPRLLREVKLQDFSIPALVRSFTAAELVEAIDSKLQITAEGIKYLQAFDLEWV